MVRIARCLEVKESSLFGLLTLIIASFLLIIVAILSHILSYEESTLSRPDSFAKSFYLRHHHSGNTSNTQWNDVKDSFNFGDVELGMVISGRRGTGGRAQNNKEKEQDV